MKVIRACRAELHSNTHVDGLGLVGTEPGEYFHPPPGNGYKRGTWLRAEGARQTASMMADRSIAIAVADAAPAEVIRQLEYKARWHGSELVLASIWFPSTQQCSKCGGLRDMPRGIAVYRCDKCGLVLGRNQNAADNLSRWPPVRRSETAVETRPNACESREVHAEGQVPGGEAGILDVDREA